MSFIGDFHLYFTNELRFEDLTPTDEIEIKKPFATSSHHVCYIQSTNRFPLFKIQTACKP